MYGEVDEDVDVPLELGELKAMFASLTSDALDSSHGETEQQIVETESELMAARHNSTTGWQQVLKQSNAV